MSYWQEFIEKERDKPYFVSLWNFVEAEYSAKECYPPKTMIFRSLQETPYENICCVILGQDPYINPGEAMGLAFSVPEGVKVPRSLRNIFAEIEAEYPYISVDKTNGNLTRWAKQGVLLLNTALTVEAGRSDSHKGHGWEIFTDNIITETDKKDSPVVFMLWGGNARKKAKLLRNKKHLVLESAHPSPLSASRGFFGNGHFRTCNEYLVKNGVEPINWK